MLDECDNRNGGEGNDQLALVIKIVVGISNEEVMVMIGSGVKPYHYSFFSCSILWFLP